MHRTKNVQQPLGRLAGLFPQVWRWLFGNIRIPGVRAGFLWVGICWGAAGCDVASPHRDSVLTAIGSRPAGSDAEPPHEHADHDHATESVKVSSRVRAGLHLNPEPLRLQTYVRKISIPASVVDWPGRTHVEVSAPMTGTVTKIHVVDGQAVESGRPLYTLRLTHQDLVQAQSEFLRLIGESDVLRREIDRLSEATRSGAIARKTLLERQYDLEKLDVDLAARRESLLLHGLSDAQVSSIETRRRLIREVVVSAPTLHADLSIHSDAIPHASPTMPPARIGLESAAKSSVQEPTLGVADRLGKTPPVPRQADEHVDTPFLVTELSARLGESVRTGQPLSTLADYTHLYARGLAFPQDLPLIRRAVLRGLPLEAWVESFSTGGSASPGGLERRWAEIAGLSISHIGGELAEESGVLPFFAPLENTMTSPQQRAGREFSSWRLRPGMRLQLRLPVAEIPEVFVAPVTAVSRDGVDEFVFVENGDTFERRPVRVVARDQRRLAIAYDGAIFPGETIATSGAYELQRALRNRSGGAVAPHAGHNH